MKQIWNKYKNINRILTFLFVFGFIVMVTTVSSHATQDTSTSTGTSLVSASNTGSDITKSPDTNTDLDEDSETTPTITGSVTVSGMTEVGQVLIAILEDIDESATVTYQWKRNSDSIDGATAETYTITEGDVGNTLAVVVSVTLSDGTVGELSTTTDIVTAEGTQDFTSVNAAKAEIEDAVFLNPTKESDYADEAAIESYVTKLVSAAMTDSTVSSEIQKVSYVAEVNGTADNVTGSSGSYTFTVLLTKGTQSATTTSRMIVIPAQVYVPVSYEVTSGDGQEIESGSSNAVTFTVNGNVENLQGVFCNGVQISSSNYDVSGDTTVSISLKGSYVQTLAAGTQEFTVSFTDGSAYLDIIVTDVVTEVPEDENQDETTEDESVEDESDEDETVEQPESEPTVTEPTEETTEEVTEETTEEVTEEVIEEDLDMDFEEVEEIPESEKVTEPDNVDMNILWIVFVIVVGIIVLEIVFVRRKSRKSRLASVAEADYDEAAEIVEEDYSREAEIIADEMIEDEIEANDNE